MVHVVEFFVTLLCAGAALRYAMRLAHRHGIVDKPGGHKTHAHSTPFVGGTAVLAALACALYVLYARELLPMHQWGALALGSLIIFVTGFADDLWQLSFKPRFAIQAGVASLMALWAGVALVDLGALLDGSPLRLGWLAIPFTVFATIGVINALNMIDGIDGLSGSVSFVSLLLIALVAHSAGVQAHLTLAVMLMAGVAAFLFFNMRYPGNRRARVFMGDNGSMLLGLLFAWMLIDLSQGEHRAMPPVLALWLFAVPLMDTVGIMTRRVWLGRSPFRPDRHHLHHLFIRAGFRVQDTVYAIALIQLAFGLAGFAMLAADVAESTMLIAFLIAFAAYFYLVLRPWRFVPALRRVHTWLGLTSPEVKGVYIGNCHPDHAELMIKGLVDYLRGRDDYRLSVYETRDASVRPGGHVYAILELLHEDSEAAQDETRRLVDSLKARFRGYRDVRVRQYLVRNDTNDRRVGIKPHALDRRLHDRRARHRKALIHSEHAIGRADAVTA
jgi:undecaprenyl-phosphate alpha-N-acetylglucosaminyl 1-phosphatetransferase